MEEHEDVDDDEKEKAGRRKTRVRKLGATLFKL